MEIAADGENMDLEQAARHRDTDAECASEQPLSQTQRDIRIVCVELLDSVTALGEAVGPKAFGAAKANSPRSLRIAAKIGAYGARRAQKRRPLPKRSSPSTDT